MVYRGFRIGSPRPPSRRSWPHRSAAAWFSSTRPRTHRSARTVRPFRRSRLAQLGWPQSKGKAFSAWANEKLRSEGVQQIQHLLIQPLKRRMSKRNQLSHPAAPRSENAQEFTTGCCCSWPTPSFRPLADWGGEARRAGRGVVERWESVGEDVGGNRDRSHVIGAGFDLFLEATGAPALFIAVDHNIRDVSGLLLPSLKTKFLAGR